MRRILTCLAVSGLTLGGVGTAGYAQTAAPAPAPPPVAAPAPAPASAAPAKTPQQAKDESECQMAATQATGYIPPAPGAAPAQPAQAAPQGHHGQRLGGAARGAAAGAVVAEVQDNNYPNAPGEVKDEYRENQVQTGAAVGMMAGGARKRQDRRQSMAAQQQAQAQAAQKQQAWTQTYKGCLTQRGYKVG